ncbi:cbb3-type cytochrome oxidase assembly protein CcoS [bacterium]|nr:cbb3-type cytochrome oxidase assembly protein CcoS [bacterium]
MNIIFLLMPIAVLLGAGFLAAFIWGVSQGQFDDLETPAHRAILPDLLEDANEGES